MLGWPSLRKRPEALCDPSQQAKLRGHWSCPKRPRAAVGQGAGALPGLWNAAAPCGQVLAPSRQINAFGVRFEGVSKRTYFDGVNTVLNCRTSSDHIQVRPPEAGLFLRLSGMAEASSSVRSPNRDQPDKTGGTRFFVPGAGPVKLQIQGFDRLQLSRRASSGNGSSG